MGRRRLQVISAEPRPLLNHAKGPAHRRSVTDKIGPFILGRKILLPGLDNLLDRVADKLPDASSGDRNTQPLVYSAGPVLHYAASTEIPKKREYNCKKPMR